jgi:3-oxoacyl-[acyl-carrier-protein] synthase III
MRVVTAAFVDSFAYSLGENKANIHDTAAAGRLVSAAEDLEAAGFRWHHMCGPETGAYDLAKAVTTRLADAGRLGAVDAIVYATGLPLNGNAGDPAEWARTRDVKHLMDFAASRLQADFGLDKAVVIGLNQQACTAMLGSLRVAAAMLGAERTWERVLCVTADRFPEGSLYEQAYNLISDGAAACVVSREPAAFRLLTVHQITNGGMGQAGDDETVGSYFAYTHRLFLETLGRVGLAVADVDWVVTQNTNDKAWRVLARMLGVDFGKVFFSSMPDVGHIISADNIVNLAELVASGQVKPGQRVVLVMAGFGLNWQCAVLEATELVGRS